MLLGHIWDFAVAVISNWIALAGGVFGVVIGIYEKSQNRPFIGKPFWRAMSLALLIACFWAWRDERVQIDKLHLDKISTTPKEIVRVFAGRTTAQGETLSATYIGKWIEVSGTIYDTEFYPSGFFIWKRARITMEDREADPSPIVIASFVETWTEAFKTLKTGEKIKALGQIYLIHKNVVQLENCELLAVVNPTPSPTPSP